MAMTKEVLQQLAEAGVRQRVADLERELAEYHKVWPTVFISPTAPQLLKAMPKPKASGTNGHWPVMTFTKTKPSAKLKESWTPKRRAEQAERMKARYKSKGTKSKKKTATTGRSDRLAKLLAYLGKHGESSIADLMTAAGYTKSAGAISAMATGLKAGTFKRTGRGRYALGPKA